MYHCKSQDWNHLFIYFTEEFLRM